MSMRDSVAAVEIAVNGLKNGAAPEGRQWDYA